MVSDEVEFVKRVGHVSSVVFHGGNSVNGELWRASCICGWRDDWRDNPSDAWSHAMNHETARNMAAGSSTSPPVIERGGYDLAPGEAPDEPKSAPWEKEHESDNF